MGFLRAHAKGLLRWALLYSVFVDKWLWHPLPGFRDRPFFPWADGRRACSDAAGLAARSNSSGLEVVLPSIGQTGTTSLAQALRVLGLRTYHAEERVAFLRPTLEADASAEAWARSTSACRVQAVSLEPFLDALPLALQTSPGAVFVLTWRDFPSWQRSTREGGFVKDLRWNLLMTRLVASSARMLPWIDVWDSLTGQFTQMIEEGAPFAGVGETPLHAMVAYYTFLRPGYNSPANDLFNRGSIKVMQEEEAYLSHMDEIRRLVPPQRLVIFDVKKDGWPELAALLGRPAPSDAVPFPHPRSKESFTNDTIWDNSSPWKTRLCLCIFAALHVVNYIIVSVLWHYLRPVFLQARALLWRSACRLLRRERSH